MEQIASNIGEQTVDITLADMVDDYMNQRQIFNEKYYSSFLKYAANAWEELFHDTLYIYNARWVQVENKDGRYKIKLPKDCKSFISANLVDECNNLQRIPYNSSVPVIEKPSSLVVTCDAIITSFVTTTKYMFSNNGVDYYQTTTLKYCPNGDIIENIKTPVKKYGQGTGDTGGSYAPDYNVDYNTPVFSNFTIDYEVSQTVLCNLDTNEDGTPINSQDNIDKLTTYCGGYSHYKNHVDSTYPVYDTENIKKYGSVTLSEDRRSLIYTPPQKHWNLNNQVILDYILIYFRGSALGNEITGAVVIPDDWFIRDAMILGTDYYSMRLNRNYSEGEKTTARARFDTAINNIIRSKLLMNVDTLNRISEIRKAW